MQTTLAIITSLWLILAPLVWPVALQAEDQPRLFLENVPVQDEKLLVVTVQVENVADLYGAEIQLRYDPAQLRVQDRDPRLDGIQIAPGELLNFEDRFVATNRVAPESGLIHFVFTLLKPAPPLSGQGILATITFEVIGPGPYPIEISQAQLVSSTLEPVPVSTADLRLSGAAVAASPAPTLPGAGPATVTEAVSRLWLWAGVAVVLLAGGVTLLVLFKTGWLAGAAEDEAAGVRRMPGRGGSATGAARLLTQQGQHARRQGDEERAYELFSQAIELDPANPTAWLGKGLVARQATEKRICLERALALEPNNETAKQALQALRGSVS